MQELQTFRGHKKEVTGFLKKKILENSKSFSSIFKTPAVAWHPIHEILFCSGGYDGQLIFWFVGSDETQSEISAHEGSIWDLDWHPVGHILASGSNDHTTKFWCRNRPNDKNNKDAESMVEKE